MKNSEQWKIWSKVAMHSFGGPAGQIASMHKILVEEKKIISEEQFLHALNFCMLLPGPEAQQLATYLGWTINRWKGGLLAGLLFILPGFISILALTICYLQFHHSSIFQNFFYGLRPAIIAIVLAALIKFYKKSLKEVRYKLITLAALISLGYFHLPFPVIILLAGLLGLTFNQSSTVNLNKSVLPPLTDTLKTLSICLIAWLAPMFIIHQLFGSQSTFHAINVFFSKVAMVTFGGAYSVLSYVSEKAVFDFRWVNSAQMLDGLAMAETTPGPLIQVVQFVAHLGAYRNPDLASAPISGLIGAILSTWMTFAPCFLWIFTFAPFVEYVRGKRIFSSILQSISAAVVGVVAHLFLSLTHSTLFNPVDYYGFFICAIAMLLQFQLSKNIFIIMLVSAVLGLIKPLILASL